MARRPTRPTFGVVAATGDDATTVLVTGDVDLATSPRLARCLEDHDGATRLVVDLTGVRFLDSSGMAVLVRAARRARKAGRGLVLRPPEDPGVRRALDVAGLLAALPFEPPAEP